MIILPASFGAHRRRPGQKATALASALEMRAKIEAEIAEAEEAIRILARRVVAERDALAEIDARRQERLDVIAAIREAIGEWEDRLIAAQARWDGNADEIESLNS